MQDKREYTGEELQSSQNTDSRFSSDNNNNQAQQMGQSRPIQENRSTFELSEIDQQEGNMNNGTLGGNFEEDVDHNRDDFSPPY